MGFLNSRSPQLRRLATFAASGGVVVFSFAFGFVTVTLLVVLGFIPASVQAVSAPELPESPPPSPAPERTADTPPAPGEAELLAESLRELKAARAELETARDTLVARDESLASLQARIESLASQLAETHREFARLEASLAAFEAEKTREKRARMNRPQEKAEIETPPQPEPIGGGDSETVAATGPAPEAGSRQSDPGVSPESTPSPPPEAPAPPAIAPILYDKGSAVNYDDRDRVVREVKAALGTHPEATIVLTGHADDSPHAQTNLDISRNRANFLAAYLRQSGGIPRDRIKAEAVGNTEAGTETPEANRRVEILVQP